MKIIITLLLILAASINTFAQTDRAQFIRIEAPLIALTHVRIIDGTGAAPVEDQTIVISEGKFSRSGQTFPTKLRSSISRVTQYSPAWLGCTTICSFPWAARHRCTQTWGQVFHVFISRSASPRFARPAASLPTPIWKSNDSSIAER